MEFKISRGIVSTFEFADLVDLQIFIISVINKSTDPAVT